MCRGVDRRMHHHQRDHRGSQRARLEPRPFVTTPPDLRVSDAERESVIALLRRHTGEGRLTLEEFEERVDEVLRARTGEDLRATLRELPALHDGRRRPLLPRSADVPAWVRPVAWLGAAVLAISVLVGHLVLWPLFFAFFFFGCGHKARRHAHPERADADRITYV